MKVFNTIEALRGELSDLTKKGLTIGFVPTMGALHEGHLKLIDRSEAENDVTVCSIFVNPIQFNNPQDLEKYPRTFDEDVEMLEKRYCDVVFHPEIKEMYPEEVTESFDFGHLDKVMEGKFRPGHFNGVAVVVKRLFEIVRPDHAYFGEKDFQQLAIVRKMVEDQGLDVNVVPCPTVREADGLAMSSRNRRLNEKERASATLLFNVLSDAKEMAGEMAPDEIRMHVKKVFDENPMFELEYFEIVGADDLLPVSTWKEKPDVIACIAAYLGDVRLIDNMYLFRNFAPLKRNGGNF